MGVTTRIGGNRRVDPPGIRKVNSGTSSSSRWRVCRSETPCPQDMTSALDSGIEVAAGSCRSTALGAAVWGGDPCAATQVTLGHSSA